MILLLIAAALILSACSSNDIAGTSTETTNGYAGVVLSSAGRPVENARVNLFNISNNEVDTTVLSDKNGTFSVIADSTEQYHLGVESGVEKSWNYFPFESLSDTVQIRMKRTGTVALENGVEQKQYLLAGTPFGTDSFHFADLPEGVYSLYDSTDNGKRTVGTFSVKSDSLSSVLIQSADDGILFEDFNDGDGNSPLFPWRNTGLFWYKEETADVGFEQRLLPDSNGFYVAIPSDEYTEKERHVGIKLGEDLDISMLDSLSFRAKGDGVLRLTFSDKVVGTTISYRKVFFKVTLTSDWQNYTVDLKNYSNVEFQGVSNWSELSGSVDFFTLFLFANQREAFVDDILFHGVTVEDMIP